MATVTPNFNWPVPTSTDLVKDGATAIEALGDSIDASLVDLKGGTTGQVLSKTSGTDMDFTWVTSDDANAIQNSIVNAKGDLIGASANDTPAIISVGANGETLVADSSTSTGLRYNPQNALVNPVLNGGMDIWQRGTSQAITSSVTTFFGPDRWNIYRGATGGTVSRQVTGDTTNLPNIQYSMRLQRDSGNTSTANIQALQNFESVNSIPYAGKAVTVSFYARAGANYSAAGNTLSVILYSGTGTDQNFFNSYTGAAVVAITDATLTTTWQRFVCTGTTAATATELALRITRETSGTAGANDWAEVTGVQIDLGTYTASSAPTFRRTGGSIQGELAACQRYFYLNTSGGTNSAFAGGFAFDASTLLAPNTMPVTMRIAPTLSATTGTNFYKVQGGGYVNNFNTLILWGATTTNVVFQNGSGTSLATQGQGLMLLTNNASSFVALSAEL